MIGAPRAIARMTGCVASCLFIITLAACSFEDTLTHCTAKSDCGSSETCDRGFCITVEVGRSPSTADKDSGSRSEGRDASNSNPDRTNTGMPNRPMDAGTSMAPKSDASTTPREDAGSAACKAGSTTSCMLPGTTAARCRAGVRHCESSGNYGPCVISETPQPETCDGIDNDCDGNTDEQPPEVCYPENTPGCTLAPNTAAMCKGRCQTGRRMCRNGKLEACKDFVTPGTESCGSSGPAADENCNDAIDETCECNAGEMRSCYTAPSNTLGVGKCQAGMQTCTNGVLGACVGAVGPKTESCANEGADDDCDGTADNILNRGVPCSVASNMGVCRSGTFQCRGAELACVTPAQTAETCNELDDDCDGKVDEDFKLMTDSAHCGTCGISCGAGEACCAGKCANLQEDENNCGACGATACKEGALCCKGQCIDTTQDDKQCGACGNACASGQSCCGGQCVDTKNDPKHCGACTTSCSTGSAPGCCEGSCVDFLSSQNCGGCGVSCGLLDGGVTCECGMTQSGIMCIAPLLGVCL